MKSISFLFAVVLTIVLGLNQTIFSQDCPYMSKTEASGSDDPAGTKVEGGMLYGKSSDPTKEVISYTDFVAKMTELNGQEVVIKGIVAEVCQAMGCWMTMNSDGKVTRVKTAHEFFLPKDVAGREAIVTGKFNITEISEDDARHYNDETKNPTVKSEDIVGPQKAYEVEASGIVILDPVTDSK